MSRMRTPEMDVIRFKEADVIVASGGRSPYTLSCNFGTGSNGRDTVITLNGNQVFDMSAYSTFDSYITALTNAGIDVESTFTNTYDDNVKTLYFLLEKEFNQGGLSKPDAWGGTINYNGSSYSRQ